LDSSVVIAGALITSEAKNSDALRQTPCEVKSCSAECHTDDWLVGTKRRVVGN